MAQVNMMDKEVVQFENGEVKGFGKRDKLIKETIRAEGGEPIGVAFYYRHGDQSICNLADLPPQMLPELIAHGLKQKLGDEGSRKEIDSSEQLQSAIEKLWHRLMAGEWNNERTASGGADYDLAAAIAQVKGKQVSVILPWLKERTKREKDALRLVPQVAEILRAMAEAAAQSVDADTLLEEI